MNTRSNYFYSVSWILLVVVFLGFAPSFYLKFLVADQPFYPNGLPIPHVVHGIILSVWYIFLVMQTRWIATKEFQRIENQGGLEQYGPCWS